MTAIRWRDFFVGLLLATGLSGLACAHDPARPGASADVEPRFELTDHTGRVVTERTLRGAPWVVYFGYTQCPDVCPRDVATLTGALRDLGTDGEGIVPVFVSVDPGRDTPAVLAGFVARFHPRLIGLTGSRRALYAAMRAFGMRALVGGAGERTVVTHDGGFVLVNARGLTAATLPAGVSRAELAAALRRVVGAGV